MIPKKEYIESPGGMFCVTYDQVMKYHEVDDCKNFNEFMFGQTGAVLSNGDFGVYAHDYQRWVNEGKRNQQSSHNWD